MVGLSMSPSTKLGGGGARWQGDLSPCSARQEGP